MRETSEIVRALVVFLSAVWEYLLRESEDRILDDSHATLTSRLCVKRTNTVQRNRKMYQCCDLCWHDIHTEFMNVICISERAQDKVAGF